MYEGVLSPPVVCVYHASLQVYVCPVQVYACPVQVYVCPVQVYVCPVQVYHVKCLLYRNWFNHGPLKLPFYHRKYVADKMWFSIIKKERKCEKLSPLTLTTNLVH